jgi:hypothetical protein|eukprot:COSAG01_NODE_127_length_24940_cov_140.519923_16_plen_143_part_00
MLLCGLGYAGGTTTYNMRVKGMALRDAAVPHPEFWSALRGLVWDGCVLTRAQLQAAANRYNGGYARVSSEAAPAPAPAPALSTPQGGEKQKKQPQVKVLAQHVEQHPTFGKAMSSAQGGAPSPVPQLGEGGEEEGDGEELVE